MIENAFAKKVIATISDENYFDDSWEIIHVEGEGAHIRYSASCKCKFATDAQLVVSLPTLTRNIYLTITDANPGLVRRVFSTLEDIEVDSGVRLGNVAWFSDSEFEEHDICAVMILPSSLFNALEELPENLSFQGKEYTFLSIVFLTNEEHEIWNSDGHDALMDYFAEIEKDVISFGNRRASNGDTE
jgi:hypothetical protein